MTLSNALPSSSYEEGEMTTRRLSLTDSTIQNTDFQLLPFKSLTLPSIVTPDQPQPMPSSVDGARISLYKKLCDAYTSLAEISMSKGRIGRSMRYSKILLSCMSLFITERTKDNCILLMRAFILKGDACATLIRSNKERELEDFQTVNPFDVRVQEVLNFQENFLLLGVNVTDFEEVFGFEGEQTYLKALDWYDMALSMADDDTDNDEAAEAVGHIFYSSFK